MLVHETKKFLGMKLQIQLDPSVQCYYEFALLPVPALLFCLLALFSSSLSILVDRGDHLCPSPLSPSNSNLPV